MLLLTGTSPRQHAKRLPFERWCLRESTRAEEVVPVRAFAETFRDTKAVRMNSKLAGVPVDVTKGAWSAEAPVDGIITSLLRSKHVNVRERLVRLSRQTTALAQGGRLVCVTQRSERIRLGGLDPVDTYDVLMGKSPLTIHVYARP